MKFYLKCIVFGMWAFTLNHTNIIAQFYQTATPSAQMLTKESYITPEMQWTIASLMNPQAVMNINKETGALDHAPSVESMIQNINTQLYISSAQKESAIKALNTMLEATEIALFKIKMKAAYHDQNYIAMFGQLTAELNNQKMAIQATLNSVKSRSTNDQTASSGSYLSWIFGGNSNNQTYHPNSMTTINPHHSSVLHIPADLAESIVKNFNFKTMPDSTQAANLLFKQCFIAQQQHEANRIPLNVNQQINSNNYIYTNFPDIYSKYSNSYPICQKVQDLVMHEPIRNNVALPVTEKQRQAYHLLLQIRQSVQLALDIANKKSSVNIGSYLPASLVSYLDGVVAELTKYDAYLNNLCKNPQFGATAQDVQDTTEWSNFTKVAAGVAVTVGVIGTMWYFGDEIKAMNPWGVAQGAGASTPGVTENAAEKDAKRKQKLADMAAIDIDADQQFKDRKAQNTSDITETSTPRKKRITDDFYADIANQNAQTPVYGTEISEEQLDTIEQEGRKADRLEAERKEKEEAEIIRRAEESAILAAEQYAKDAQEHREAEALVAQQNVLATQQPTAEVLTSDVSTLINNNATSTEPIGKPKKETTITPKKTEIEFIATKTQTHDFDKKRTEQQDAKTRKKMYEDALAGDEELANMPEPSFGLQDKAKELKDFTVNMVEKLNPKKYLQEEQDRRFAEKQATAEKFKAKVDRAKRRIGYTGSYTTEEKQDLAEYARLEKEINDETVKKAVEQKRIDMQNTEKNKHIVERENNQRIFREEITLLEGEKTRQLKLLETAQKAERHILQQIDKMNNEKAELQTLIQTLPVLIQNATTAKADLTKQKTDDCSKTGIYYNQWEMNGVLTPEEIATNEKHCRASTTALDNATTALSNLEAKFKKVKADLDSYSTTFVATADLDSYSTTFVATNEDLTKKRKEITDINTAIKDLNTKISGLHQKIKDLEPGVWTLASQAFKSISSNTNTKTSSASKPQNNLDSMADSYQ